MSHDQSATATPSARVTFRMLLCGVFLPLMALGAELMCNFSAQTFFDPIPTWLHILLVAAVPVLNAALIYAIHNQHTQHSNKLAHANAFVIGITAVFTVLYLPLLPIGIITILWFGIGFLLLSPILSLWATIRLRTELGKQTTLPKAGWGLILALSLLTVAEAPLMLTNIGLHMATHADTPADRLSGIRWLRVLGDEKTLLRLCYERSGISTDWLGRWLNWHNPVSLEESRTAFYQVTGHAFNELPTPILKTRSSRFFDSNVGSETVGQRNQNVALTASRIDGIVDAQDNSAYLEWTMVFTNHDSINNEGRGQILLPPDAVVSRVTLWINGEEREAAFGGRNQVRQAYQKVVAKNRDPVLVTTQGKDRILLQLFPIPPRGGEMKLRIGITTPLALNQLSQGQLQLPVFRERNFTVNTLHNVWLESKTALSASGIARPSNELQLQAALDDAQLEQVVLHAARDATQNSSWHGNGSVQQLISQQANKPPQRAVLVIDGSQSMQAVQQHIRRALPQLPKQLQLGLVLAGDETQAFLPLRQDAFDRTIQQFHFVGGHDNSAALSQAWQWASARPDSVIVWIHGPQPVLIGGAEALLQQQQRGQHPVKLLQLEAVPGANKPMEKLDGISGITNLPRTGDITVQLSQLFQQWHGNSQHIHIQRVAHATPDKVDHIVRLWAAEQVTQQGKRDEAITLAQRYQLVTPVTGAVVLETQQQYQDAGLEPVAPNTVPTIPEPETWLMIILVLAVLAAQVRRIRIKRHAYTTAARL